MAQTGNFTPILLYSSSTTGNTPGAANLTNSANGSELAINIADGRLFYKDPGGTVQQIADKLWIGTVTSVSGTGSVNGITLTGTVTSSGNITLGGTLGNIANSQLTNSTISGVSLGGNLFNLTAGTNISFSSGTTYNGSAAITINVANTVTSFSAGTTGLTPNTSTTGAITLAGTLAVANGGTGMTTGGPAFSAYGNTNQTISSGVATKVVINTEQFDTNSNFDTSTYRFTPTVAGYYQVNGVVEAYGGGMSISAYALSLYKNGSEFIRGTLLSGLLPDEVYPNVSGIVYMNGSTDYLELYMSVTSLGTITLYGSNSYKLFSAGMIRSA